MMIEIDSLKKSYDGTRALDEFSLRVEAGEAVGLVGPNGAGKTTLIKILATLLRPDGGRARIAGHDVSRGPCVPSSAICPTSPASTTTCG